MMPRRLPRAVSRLAAFAISLAAPAAVLAQTLEDTCGPVAQASSDYLRIWDALVNSAEGASDAGTSEATVRSLRRSGEAAKRGAATLSGALDRLLGKLQPAGVSPAGLDDRVATRLRAAHPPAAELIAREGGAHAVLVTARRLLPDLPARVDAVIARAGRAERTAAPAPRPTVACAVFEAQVVASAIRSKVDAIELQRMVERCGTGAR
jgi:hypothetical protein